MIKRNPSVPRKIYGPNLRQLAWAAFKGAGMGALIAAVAVKLIG